MPEYLAPGVYVEEVERGAKPIAGVSTSTAGFLGPTERGPTEPRLLTSFADFERLYGGYLEESHMATGVEGFFANGGKRCYVGRIAADGEETAQGGVPIEGEDDLEALLAADPGTVDFGDVAADDEATETVTLEHVGDEDDGTIEIDLSRHEEIETTMDDDGVFEVDWGDDETDYDETVTLEPRPEDEDEADEENWERDLEVTFNPEDEVWRHWARLTIEPEGNIEPVEVDLEGYNDGESGNDLLETESVLDFVLTEEDDETEIELTVEHESGGNIEIDPDDCTIIGPNNEDFELDEDDTITVGEGGEEDLTVTFELAEEGRRDATLLIAHDGDNSPLVVQLRGWNGIAMEAEAIGPGEWGGHVAIITEDAAMYDAERNDLFKLVVRYWADDEDVEAAAAGSADPDRDGVPEPDVEEVFDDLSPEETSSNYYVGQVNGTSMLIEIDPETARTDRPAIDVGPRWLEIPEDDGGDDTDIDAEDYRGDPTAPPEDRTGFAGFEKVDEISIVCVPDEHDHEVTDDLIQHCRDMDDRFAILQAPQSPGPTADLRPPEDTDMAAFYYPWLEVTDPNTGMIEEVPPGGHVAGIYARSDAQRGVHKAPANEVVRGIEGLQRTITKGEQEVLNPRGVNCIRSFRGRGIRVWGARTASSDPAWRYVNVRRLFLFLRESIEEGTQWVVFEPNDEQLWARVRQTISNFLTDVWDDGALMGTSPDEAFFVKCDRSTMTQNDIENGRLICEIGVAPVRPAEFVVFRISQWTASAE